MPNPSNSDLVGEAKRLSEAATPGPWRWADWGDQPVDESGRWLEGPVRSDAGPDAPVSRRGLHALVVAAEDEPKHWDNPADAEFIARARTLLPELAQQLEQAEQRETRYREALERIASREAFGTPGILGHGWEANEARQRMEMARAALTPDEGADPGGR